MVDYKLTVQTPTENIEGDVVQSSFTEDQLNEMLQELIIEGKNYDYFFPLTVTNHYDYAELEPSVKVIHIGPEVLKNSTITIQFS